MEQPAQRGLQSQPQLAAAHFSRSPGYSSMLFDPCAAAVNLPLHGGVSQDITR
jgi:hypothetical protein